MPAGASMDVLDDILGSLRLTGGVVVDGEFTRRLLRERGVHARSISRPSSRAGKADQLSLRPVGQLDRGGRRTAAGRSQAGRHRDPAAQRPASAREPGRSSAGRRERDQPGHRRRRAPGRDRDRRAQGRGVVRLSRRRQAAARIRCSMRCRRCSPSTSLAARRNGSTARCGSWPSSSPPRRWSPGLPSCS